VDVLPLFSSTLTIISAVFLPLFFSHDVIGGCPFLSCCLDSSSSFPCNLDDCFVLTASLRITFPSPPPKRFSRSSFLCHEYPSSHSYHPPSHSPPSVASSCSSYPDDFPHTLTLSPSPMRIRIFLASSVVVEKPCCLRSFDGSFSSRTVFSHIPNHFPPPLPLFCPPQFSSPHPKMYV